MNVLILITSGMVFLVLCAGLYTLFRGGDFARSYSNKLMRLRVLLQFIAICAVMLALIVSGNGPG